MKRTDSLYTWVVLFRGGTFISQVKAGSVHESVQAWLEYQEEHLGDIPFLGEKTLQEIRTAFAEEEDTRPIPLRGMKNAWFCLVLSRMGALHINIVETL